MADEIDLYGDLYNDAEVPQAAEEDDSKPVVPSEAYADERAPAPYEDTKPYATGPPQGGDGYGQQGPSQGYGQSQGGPPPRFDGGNQQGSLNVRPGDMPEEGKMFVGGLNWDTTDAGLKTYFEQFGAITHCTIMRDGETQRSRGFAFLTFADASSVNAVMTREHYLDGKTIDPKRAIPRENSQKTDKLFVRSIPNSCTQESFRTFWRQFGNITDATLMMDKESGRHRGFGFVNYEHVDSVERVLSTGPHMMEGQTLEVKRAQLKGEVRQAGYGTSHGGHGGGGGYNNQSGGGYGNQNPGTQGGNNQGNMGPGNAAFDPQKMAQFFNQMNWGGWNPMMMMAGGTMPPGLMPGMGMPGMGMPGMGMPGMMGGMGGMPPMMGDPNMMYGGGPPMGQGGNMRGGYSGRGGRGGGGGGGGGGRGPNEYYSGPAPGPTGPASMRDGDGPPPPAGPESSGAGPTRSRGGGSGFHPYSRN